MSDRFQRVAGAQFGQFGRVKQLQELDHEFDVANAAAARFDVADVAAFGNGALFDPPLKRLDAGNIGPAEIAAIDPRLELGQIERLLNALLHCPVEEGDLPFEVILVIEEAIPH